MVFSVAIVGRPNVGKSRLFNRLARKRIAIVHDQPGITRDVLSAVVEDGGYTLLDTGGLGLKGGDTPAQLIAASEVQVGFAIDVASLILFVVDGFESITALDQKIADRLRRARKNVLLVVNKADRGEHKMDFAECHRLGFGEPLLVSAEHGTGEDDLRAAIAARLAAAQPAHPPEPPRAEGEEKPLCICFIGRPNVGKSSLGNTLLESNRLLVSDVPGTTRDAVELPFGFRDRRGRIHPFRLIDTAGIKAASKLISPVEYFSRLRSLDAIQRADVIFLVLDAMDGVTQQDKAVAGEAVKERKPIVVLVNKWDLVLKAFKSPEGLSSYKNERDYRKKYEHAVFDRLFFTPGAPLIFVSAMSGTEIDRMLNAAVQLNRVLDKKLPTAKLNQTLIHLTERTPPPSVGGRRFRIYYATQTGNRPFRIKMFCNREEKLTESYRRYLEAGLVEAFGLQGCPFAFELVGKPKNDDRRRGSAGRTEED
jgi:GTP-binding protein